jgi:hypothetical protein
MNSSEKWIRRERADLREYPAKMKSRGAVDESLDELAKCGAGECDLAMATSISVPDELAPLISRAAREWQLEPLA